MTSTLPVGVTGTASLPVAERGSGAIVYDDQGRDYVDGSSGPICVNLGHGVPEILTALWDQAERLCFAHRSQFTVPAVAALTREIIAVAGEAYREVVYTNSGSEATETALRLALRHHHERGRRERTVVLTQYPSYHGMTAGALGVSGHPLRRVGLDALHRNGISTLPVRSGRPERLLPDLADWSAVIDRVGAHRVAAVLLEPVSGAAGGAATVDDDVLRGLRDLCDANGPLLVVDEVMTGFGRAGQWFAHQRAGVVADLVVTGKGLSAGYTPIGACLVHERVLPGHPVTELAFGHTMSGNPLSAATALAVLRYTAAHRLPERAVEVGARLCARLAELAGEIPFLGPPRGRGLLLGVPVRQPDAEWSHAPLNQRICALARRHGLILYPAGVDPRSQAVLVAPPLTIDDRELDLLTGRLAATVRELAGELHLGRAG
ncbi:aminotransferase class III-fold pyridoxal phosphate-dependent enzyme [Micromonospora echinospora]